MNQNLNPNQDSNNQQVEVVDLSGMQVLNMDDVEQTVMYEKRTSKRPIIMLAIAGLFSIVMGLLYPVIMSALDGPEEEKAPEPVVFRYVLNCNLSVTGNVDGTDSNTAITFNFENSELVNYTKTINILPTPGNAMGVSNIQNYFNTFKTYEQNEIPGYTISSETVGTGFNSSVTVDFKKFDTLKLPDDYKANTFTNVNYEKSQTVNEVKEQVILAGYTCDR